MDNFLLFLKDFTNQYGLLVYFLVFIISFLESFAFIGEFVPGAIFAVSSGALASKGILDIYILFLSGFLGAFLADVASFYSAIFLYDKIKNKPFILKQNDLIERGIVFFDKFGGLSVFIGRFIGALRPVVPFVAGLCNMSKLQFFFWAFLSGLLWSLSYFGVGYIFGNNWPLIKHTLAKIDFDFIILAVIILMAYYAVYVRRSK